MPYLTKSRFKIACECPSKLHYSLQPEKYSNQQIDDDFLKQLAEGGFQVGALAQCYYPEGINLNEEADINDHATLAAKTLEYLQQGDCILYEAAFLWSNCFVKTDIVVRSGNTVQLFEVKAGSISPSTDRFWQSKKEELKTDWLDYLLDISFQTYVAAKCLEQNGINLMTDSYLMLANKDAVASVDGLNQIFVIDNKKVVTRFSNVSELGTKVLIAVNVNKEVKHILENGNIADRDFKEAVRSFEESVLKGEKISSPVSTACKKCQFKNPLQQPGMLDGFRECWQKEKGFKDADFAEAFSWEVRGTTKARQFLTDGKYFMKHITRADLEPKNPSRTAYPGMSNIDRQEMQVQKYLRKEAEPFVMKERLKAEMSTWKYPLHFIDFEGTRVALPFYKNMKPYEQVAFQFSHHIVYENGTIEHTTEWLNTQQGYFPNYDFVRELKKAIGKDEGTVFRYHIYENTVLNCIREQLLQSSVEDKDELIAFIENLTSRKDGHVGYRNMVDLCEVIKNYYYNPLTKGSNSIKDVLPAILNTSKQLQAKYSEPVYGSTMVSKNFNDHIWIQRDEHGKVKDPYKLLAPIFGNYDEATMEQLLTGGQEDAVVQNGGGAMAAYAKMQFCEISPEEKKELEKQLLRYCELDTLAMVMIWEELLSVCINK